MVETQITPNQEAQMQNDQTLTDKDLDTLLLSEKPYPWAYLCALHTGLLLLSIFHFYNSYSDAKLYAGDHGFPGLRVWHMIPTTFFRPDRLYSGDVLNNIEMAKLWLFQLFFYITLLCVHYFILYRRRLFHRRIVATLHKLNALPPEATSP